jgi:hypothetical protein
MLAAEHETLPEPMGEASRMILSDLEGSMLLARTDGGITRFSRQPNGSSTLTPA